MPIAIRRMRHRLFGTHYFVPGIIFYSGRDPYAAELYYCYFCHARAAKP